ncbi:type II secretion system F family protein [Alicyclobacillus sp. ALC3]|uniref:type II secretion system F family protein n=1 Tax=Alicyclobacillus sp. ALC3 TaxID=2796143 RepID=UPI0023791ADF|nr:type II secretion system F family protein [Alicyclobacillus sp. ALC3]WDL95317.1 type II secretion system F family protein [Alicyclobacillus sp. ALC3]
MKWLIFATLAIWFYLLFSFLTVRRRRVRDRLVEYVFEGADLRKRPESAQPRVAIWHRILGSFTQSWIRRWPRKRLERIQTRLLRAHSSLTVGEWISLQLFTVIGGVVLGIVVFITSGHQPKALFICLAVIILAWIMPDFMLSRRITQRQNTLRKQLPSTLDLLTVSVEAGLGFDQAMSKVAEEAKGPMAEESKRILHEMQLGTPRLQALQRFAERTGVDVIELFVSAVVQADKLGIGLTKVLRIQAEDVRRKQREAAQEQAAKAPLKILFPLIMFIFPALFVVILGPAVLHIVQLFKHTGGL